MIFKKFKKSGFTLIETILVIVVLGILASIGVAALLEMTDSVVFVNKREPTRAEFRLIASKITRDIRRTDDELSINNATSALINFDNVDEDNIIYSLSGTDLIRTENGISYTLSRDVSSFVLSYYDDYGISIVPEFTAGIPTNIRLVRIDLAIEDEAGDLNEELQIRPKNISAVGKLFW